MAKPNWTRIKNAYVTGTDGYRAMAAKYGVPLKTLSARAKKEGWAAARRQYRDEVAAGYRARAREEEIDRLITLRGAADDMARVIGDAMQDADQWRRHLVLETDADSGATTTVERLFGKIDTRALRDTVAAMKDLTAVLRDLHGAANERDQLAMEIARRKMALEERRAGAAGEEDYTGVVLLPEVSRGGPGDGGPGDGEPGGGGPGGERA